jgi:hypothetical protein
VYKVLAQTVPDTAKTDPLRDMEAYLATMIRQVDSSLLEEWERMRDPAYRPRGEARELRPPGAEEAAQDITRDPRAFTALARARVFAFLRAWSHRDFEEALAGLAHAEDGDGQPWTPPRLEQTLAAYLAAHGRLCLDPEARNLRHTHTTPTADRQAWRLDQMLVDPEGHNDWVAEFAVDLAASRSAREPVLRLRRLGSLV